MEPTPEAARAIARAAYIFLYPLVVNYGVAYQMAFDPLSGRGGFGRWRRRPAVAPTPGRARKAVRQVSCTWLDLGPQPMLMVAPPRGWGGCVTQWFDLWGFTPEVSGVEPQRRATGAPFLISASADDAICAGTDAEVRSETRLVNVCCTQDLPPSSRTLQPGVVEDPEVMPLSAYLGFDTPSPAPTNWFRWHEAVLTGPDFWGCAAFALSLARPHPDDIAILDRLREIGVVAGIERDPAAFDEQVTWAIDLGMYQAIEELVRSAGGVRGGHSWPTRRQIDRDYFARAVRALAGQHLGRTRRGLSLVFDGQ